MARRSSLYTVFIRCPANNIIIYNFSSPYKAITVVLKGQKDL